MQVVVDDNDERQTDTDNVIAQSSLPVNSMIIRDAHGYPDQSR